MPCAVGDTVGAWSGPVTGMWVADNRAVSNIVLDKPGCSESVDMIAGGCTAGTRTAEIESTPSAASAGQSCDTEAPAWG